MSNETNTSPSFEVTIFMEDGRMDGIKVVEKGNWDGIGVICPRRRYSDAKKTSKEFKYAGVYILIDDMSVEEDPSIYVGETESLRSRLDQHVKWDFWKHVIFFTRKDDDKPLNKTDIRYLESELLARARLYQRCKILNKHLPEKPKRSAKGEVTIKGYLKEMLALLPFFNITFFEDVPSLKILKKTGQKPKIFKYLEAEGYETSDGNLGRRPWPFVVLKDSISFAEKDPKNSINPHTRKSSHGLLMTEF